VPVWYRVGKITVVIFRPSFYETVLQLSTFYAVTFKVRGSMVLINTRWRLREKTRYESFYIIRHINEFIGKRFCAAETVNPCTGPKWGRWVYERGYLLAPGRCR